MNAMGAVTLVIDTTGDWETTYRKQCSHWQAQCACCAAQKHLNQSVPLTSSCSVIATQKNQECIHTRCCFRIADWFRSLPTSFVPPKSRAGSDRPETVRVVCCGNSQSQWDESVWTFSSSDAQPWFGKCQVVSSTFARGRTLWNRVFHLHILTALPNCLASSRHLVQCHIYMQPNGHSFLWAMSAFIV